MDITVKKAARAQGFAARKLAFDAGQGQAAEILADVLATKRGKVLAGYMPMRTEIDPLPAMAAHQGVVCVPVIMGAGQALRFREWSPGCALVAGEFGAMIPAEGAWVEPEVLMDGDHNIQQCAEATEATLRTVYAELAEQRVLLEGTLLKPNMVLSGKSSSSQASVKEVAEATVRCFRLLPEQITSC